MRPSAPASLQLESSLLAERIAHSPSSLPPNTFHLDIGHLARGPQLIEPELVAAVGVPTMHKLHPRKIIQVPALTRDEEPCRNNRRRLTLLVAVAMHVPAPVF
jgi:hypothetical protein